MSPFPAENMIKHESRRRPMVRENDIQVLVFLASDFVLQFFGGGRGKEV